jgi:peptidoglycan hydrolase-like protein with peptidoglycan-binding domain
MSLKYPPFAACVPMQDAARNAPALKRGARGVAVGLLQGALVDLGYKLPKSMAKSGAPDEIYGQETFDAVWAFQTKEKLKKDGQAGKNTIERLDQLMAAKAKPAPYKPPVAPPPPSTIEYKLGSADPKRSADPGAGIWGATPAQASYRALKTGIEAILPPATRIIGEDAVAHMRHYLDNSGKPYTIRLAGMLEQVPSARERYEDEVAQAQEFVEKLAVGRHLITSQQAETGYNTKAENWNWFYAIGGYSVWGKGVAHVAQGASGREYKLEFEYKFYDRYNWDKGKSVTIAGITITDEFMGEFHRQGIAQEFDCHGSIKRTFVWKPGQAIPRSQLYPPGGQR